MAEVEDGYKMVSARCVWFENKLCKIPDDVLCADDCDLKDLPWEKDAITNQMKQEYEMVNQFKKDGMWKNRRKIEDKIGGITTMNKALIMITGEKTPIVLDGDMVSHADTKPVNLPKKGFGGWRT